MSEREIKNWKRAGLVWFALVFTSAPFTALAYIDPSVSSYIIQAVVGVAVAVGAFAAIYWRRAKKKVQDKLGIDENANKQKEEEVKIFTGEEKNQNGTDT